MNNEGQESRHFSAEKCMLREGKIPNPSIITYYLLLVNYYLRLYSPRVFGASVGWPVR
jgi:hypothetical protein